MFIGLHNGDTLHLVLTDDSELPTAQWSIVFNFHLATAASPETQKQLCLPSAEIWCHEMGATKVQEVAYCRPQSALQDVR